MPHPRKESFAGDDPRPAERHWRPKVRSDEGRQMIVTEDTRSLLITEETR